MQASPASEDWVRRLVTQHYAAYPTATMSEATLPAWWAELEDIPIEVLAKAFQLAREASPTFPPTAPQVRATAQVEAAKLAKDRADRKQEQLFKALPAPSGPDHALQEFYRLVDDALAKELGEKVSADNGYLLTGVLVALGAVYDYPREVMVGDPDATEPEKRFRYTTTMVHGWERDNRNPHVVLRALRQVPSIFRRFPTELMLRELIRGEFGTRGWPEEWLAIEAE